MRIMIGTEKRIDRKASLINYYTLEKDMSHIKNSKYCNTLMLVARIMIYTLYYKEDQIIRNSVINYQFRKMLILISIFLISGRCVPHSSIIKFIIGKQTS